MAFFTPLTCVMRYKMSGNPIKNQRKTLRRNSLCKETRNAGT